VGRGFLSAMGLGETPNPQHCVHYHVEKPQDRQSEFSAAVPGGRFLAQLPFRTARVTVQIPLPVFVHAHDFHKESLATLTRRQILHTEGQVIGQGRHPRIDPKTARSERASSTSTITSHGVCVCSFSVFRRLIASHRCSWLGSPAASKTGDMRLPLFGWAVSAVSGPASAGQAHIGLSNPALCPRGPTSEPGSTD